VKSITDRDTVVAQGSLLIAAKWADGWCDDMRKNGRAVAGGWPGTLPEARARVTAYFERELARRGMLQLSSDELVSATRATYERAKQAWFSAQLAGQRRERRSGSEP
jgi:hypothetical protein